MLFVCESVCVCVCVCVYVRVYLSLSLFPSNLFLWNSLLPVGQGGGGARGRADLLALPNYNCPHVSLSVRHLSETMLKLNTTLRWWQKEKTELKSLAYFIQNVNYLR